MTELHFETATVQYGLKWGKSGSWVIRTTGDPPSASCVSFKLILNQAQCFVIRQTFNAALFTTQNIHLSNSFLDLSRPPALAVRLMHGTLPDGTWLGSLCPSIVSSL